MNMGELLDSFMAGGPHYDYVDCGPGAELGVTALVTLEPWEYAQVDLEPVAHPVRLINRAYGFADGADPEIEAKVMASIGPHVEQHSLPGPRLTGWWNLEEFVAAVLRCLQTMLTERQPIGWPTREQSLLGLRSDPFRVWHWGDTVRWTCSYSHCISSCLGCYPGHRVYEWIAAHPRMRAAWAAALNGLIP
jgi:hypothetical protein